MFLFVILVFIFSRFYLGMKSCLIFTNITEKILWRHSMIFIILTSNWEQLKQYLFYCKFLQYNIFVMTNNMQWIKSIHSKMYVSNINNHDRYIKRMRKTINDLSMWLVYVIGFTSIKFVALSIRSFSMVYWLDVATCYSPPPNPNILCISEQETSRVLVYSLTLSGA